MSNSTVVLSNSLIFDAKRSPLFTGDIVVKNGVIAAIEVAGSVNRTDVARIDCDGRFITPGLIDAHAHVAAIDYHFGEQDSHYSQPVATFLVAGRLRRLLDQGFTTVRDAGGADWGYKEAIDRGLIVGPNLLISGKAFSQTGGHGDHRSRYDDSADFHGNTSSHTVVDGVEEMRRAVRDQFRRGADQIKVMASGGAVSANDKLDSTQFSLEELTVAVHEAEAVGSYVMAHSLSSRAIRTCIEAGVRTIEHGNFLDEETAALMAETGTYLIPTAIVYENAAANQAKIGFSEAVGEKLRVAAGRCRDVIRLAHSAGVKVGYGTDLLAEYVNRMGAGLYIHVEELGAEEALIGATSINAEAIGLGDRVGTIEVGKAADFVLFNQNLIENPEAIAHESSIDLVIKGGEVHQR